LTAAEAAIFLTILEKSTFSAAKMATKIRNIRIIRRCPGQHAQLAREWFALVPQASDAHLKRLRAY
jgi:hypothetical protein